MIGNADFEYLGLLVFESFLILFSSGEDYFEDGKR